LEHETTTVYTIGHSTRDLADFSRVLQAHDIRLLEDIRAFPVSRRYPISTGNIWNYGCRKSVAIMYGKKISAAESKQIRQTNHPMLHSGIRHFRNYADYMLSSRFHEAITDLWSVRSKRTRRSCALSMFIFAAIACWCQTTWQVADTPCSIYRMKNTALSCLDKKREDR